MSLPEIFYTKLKKSLTHCQGFIEAFELGEGGTFMYLLREGVGGEIY